MIKTAAQILTELGPEADRKHNYPANRKRKCPEFCTLPDCSDPYLAKGYCSRHYQANRSWGNPYAIRPPRPTAM